MWRISWACVPLVLWMACICRGADRFVIVDEGRAACSIVISSSASPAEKRGANELQSHLKRMSSAEIPIVTDDQPLPSRGILLGHSRHTDALNVHVDPALGDEGFIIRTVGSHLVLAGNGQRGTLYACTSLLETLGVRWFTPTVTRFPTLRTIAIVTTDESQSPAFEYREPFFTEAFDKDWAARLKMNGQSMHLDESTGGKVEYYQFVHTMDLLVPRDAFAAHPEYFPLIKGKRTNGYVQRCLSNPTVLQLAIEHVRQWMKEAPGAKIYSVSQNDTYNFCECDECKAIETKYGGNHSGLYLWFANEVAEAIEKEHPDKLIDTLAYQFTESPPAGISPRRNVRVRLCPIACCNAHAYEQCLAPANVKFMQNLRGWAALTDSLYIWHYSTDFANYLLPFPDFNEFPVEIRLYKKSGVKGVFFEGDAATGGGGSDAELRSYVMARQLWNPSLDTGELVAEWMHGVYGNAAEPMQKWFALLHEQVRDPNQHLFIWTAPASPIFAPPVIEKADALFDDAEKRAAGDPVATDYVAKARLSLRFVKLVQHPAGGDEYQHFIADLHRRGIASIREGQPLETWEKEYLAHVHPNP